MDGWMDGWMDEWRKLNRSRTKGEKGINRRYENSTRDVERGSKRDSDREEE